MTGNVVDCTAFPPILSGFSYLELDQLPGTVHKRLIWLPERMSLFNPLKEGEIGINMREFFLRVADETVLPVHVMRFLLLNTQLIPEECRTQEGGLLKCIIFCTILRDGQDERYLPYMYCYYGRWYNALHTCSRALITPGNFVATWRW